MHVLVVDDDPDFAEGIGLTLELEGHRVTYAASGEEAIKTFGNEEFDATLMDVRMPGIDGVESLRRILEIDSTAKVVMITAHSVESVLQDVLSDGAFGILQKPVTSKDLLDKLGQIQPGQIVLIADDDSDFVEGVEAILSDDGYSVITAGSGKEALNAVMYRDIDLLLLDIKLPDLNGLEVYSQLLRLARTPPTIIVTGFRREEAENIEELVRLSNAECLVKPIASDQLLQAVRLAT